MADTLINRVAKSGIITINLEQYYPEAEIVTFDLKEYLHMELILREKEFRQALLDHDWTQYQGKVLLIVCTSDAIIPMWAYMLVASHAEGYAEEVYVGDVAAYLNHHYYNVVTQLDVSTYQDKRIVIKGCSNKPVPAGAYQALTLRLRPVALSIMFGEPCSMVPIWKAKK